MKKYYLISSKSDDYGADNKMVIIAKEKDIKKVYSYKEIPKEHYDILKIYLGDFDEYYDKEQLEEYFG